MQKNATTGKCQCPDNYPLLAGGICRDCNNSSHYFDLTTSKCALCPNGMSVSLDNNTCMCFANQIYKNHSCVCPDDLPYLARDGCIACNLPKYFNATSRKC